MLSASTALSSFRSTFSSLRFSGSIVVFEKLLGVHFAQAFEPLDLHAAPADLDDLLQNLRE